MLTTNNQISNTQGNIKLSVLSGSTHVLPHCGLTNSKLRAHLPLIVPSDPAPWLRVAQENVTWNEGKQIGLQNWN